MGNVSLGLFIEGLTDSFGKFPAVWQVHQDMHTGSFVSLR